VADQTPLRSGKANLYEGGIRVPLIVRWPGKVPSGSTCSEIVSSIDWFPTLLSVAKSKQSYLNVDGVDLLPVLLEKQSLDRDALYWHYPHYHSTGSGPSGAVREGDFKLIEWYENSLTNGDNAVELYNLADDLSETTNLASDMPQKANDLMNKLKTWRTKVGAQMPEITTNRD
jgi:arylsulfatase A-like enzyme